MTGRGRDTPLIPALTFMFDLICQLLHSFDHQWSAIDMVFSHDDSNGKKNVGKLQHKPGKISRKSMFKCCGSQLFTSGISALVKWSVFLCDAYLSVNGPLPLTVQEQGRGTANNYGCSDKSSSTSPNSRTVLHWQSFVYVDIHMSEQSGFWRVSCLLSPPTPGYNLKGTVRRFGTSPLKDVNSPPLERKRARLHMQISEYIPQHFRVRQWSWFA